MGKVKGRSILVVLVLLFGAYAFYDFHQEQKEETKKKEDAQLLTINADQMESITMVKGDSKVVVVSTVDGWKLTEPIQDWADSVYVEDDLKYAFASSIIDVASEGKDVNWATYGLDKPTGKVTFKDHNGKSNTIELSSKKNFEGSLFARRDGENKVLVIPVSWAEKFEAPAEEFRDRRFLRHKIAAVQALEITNDKGTLELDKKDDQWILGSQKDRLLDQEKVRNLLKVISDAKAREIVSGALPPLKHLLFLRLQLDDKMWTAEVGQAPDKMIYATISDPKFNMKMASGALDKLIRMRAEDLYEAEISKKAPKMTLKKVTK